MEGVPSSSLAFVQSTRPRKRKGIMAVRVTASECKNSQTIPLPPKEHIDPTRECKALSTILDIV